MTREEIIKGIKKIHDKLYVYTEYRKTTEACLKLLEDEAAVDKSYLYDWYIHSVSEDDAPVWTEEHIDELIKDFECYPKRAADEALRGEQE